MTPLKDFTCHGCCVAYDDVLLNTGESFKCLVCGNELKAELSFAANYTIAGDNSASCRPRKSKSTEN